MAYVLPPTSSLDALILYVGTRVALFSAEEEHLAIAQWWRDMLKRARTARDARDDARIATEAARSSVQLCDARWDKTVHDLAGVALTESDRNPKKRPYSQLFGTVNATRAKKLGIAKATSFGALLVSTLKALGNSKLLPFAGELERRNEALDGAAKVRLERTLEERTHAIHRLSLIDDIERLIAITQIELLKRYPGDDALVAAYLSPHKPRTTKKPVLTEDELDDDVEFDEDFDIDAGEEDDAA